MSTQPSGDADAITRLVKEMRSEEFRSIGGWVWASRIGAMADQLEAIAARLPFSTNEDAHADLAADRRDGRLLHELRAYLNTLTITSDTIGDIRRSLFMPWGSPWNTWVRDETARREAHVEQGHDQ